MRDEGRLDETFVDPWLEMTLEKTETQAKRARYIGRNASASTAAGLGSRNLKELEAFTTEAFAAYSAATDCARAPRSIATIPISLTLNGVVW